MKCSHCGVRIKIGEAEWVDGKPVCKDCIRPAQGKPLARGPFDFRKKKDRKSKGIK